MLLTVSNLCPVGLKFLIARSNFLGGNYDLAYLAEE